jgi:hypothetical protein
VAGQPHRRREPEAPPRDARQGPGYALVWPNEDNVPEVSIESAERDDRRDRSREGVEARRRAEAVRRARTDTCTPSSTCPTGLQVPVGPEGLATSADALVWIRASGRRRRRGEAWPIENPIGVVPVVPFVHQPDLTTGRTRRSRRSPRARTRSTSPGRRLRGRRVRVVPTALGDRHRHPGRPGHGARRAVPDGRRPPVGRCRRPTMTDARRDVAPPVQFGEFDVTPLAPFYEAITARSR